MSQRQTYRAWLTSQINGLEEDSIHQRKSHETHHNLEGAEGTSGSDGTNISDAPQKSFPYGRVARCKPLLKESHEKYQFAPNHEGDKKNMWKMLL